MIPPNLLSHASFDVYDTNGEPDGNPLKAAPLWKNAFGGMDKLIANLAEAKPSILPAAT